jgi:tetraacyldisaccharide 4'-kinase
MSFRLLLYPFAIIYGIAVFIRNKLFDLKILSSHKFDLPVISVGNITAGGTGKTPHVEYLISVLKDKYNLAVLSRGYKRKTKSFIIASENSEIKEIGDEPWQIKHKFSKVLVAVDNKRVNGVKNILKADNKIEVIILDDAFQHRRITPGFSILLIDYSRPVFSDHLLPAGLLRESTREIKRADVIIITKSQDEISGDLINQFRKKLLLKPGQLLFTTKLFYNDPKPVFINQYKTVDFLNKDVSVILITGIANPKQLTDYLSGKFREIIHLKFYDHHNYNDIDLEKIAKKFHEINDGKAILLTTEKDAVKFQNLKNNTVLCTLPVFYIPIEIQFHNVNEENNFKNNLIDYVRANIRTNKRND